MNVRDTWWRSRTRSNDRLRHARRSCVGRCLTIVVRDGRQAVLPRRVPRWVDGRRGNVFGRVHSRQMWPETGRDTFDSIPNNLSVLEWSNLNFVSRSICCREFEWGEKRIDSSMVRWHLNRAEHLGSIHKTSCDRYSVESMAWSSPNEREPPIGASIELSVCSWRDIERLIVALACPRRATDARRTDRDVKVRTIVANDDIDSRDPEYFPVFAQRTCVTIVWWSSLEIRWCRKNNVDRIDPRITDDRNTHWRRSRR